MTVSTNDPAHSKSRIARYRLLVVDRLCSHTTLTVADLADEIAVSERESPLTDVDARVVVDVYSELCETVLPDLARMSLVVYDEEADLVSRVGYGFDASVAVSDGSLPSPDESKLS